MQPIYSQVKKKPKNVKPEPAVENLPVTSEPAQQLNAHSIQPTIAAHLYQNLPVEPIPQAQLYENIGLQRSTSTDVSTAVAAMPAQLEQKRRTARRNSLPIAPVMPKAQRQTQPPQVEEEDIFVDVDVLRRQVCCCGEYVRR